MIASIGMGLLIACAGNSPPTNDLPTSRPDGPAVEVGPREVIAVFPRSVGSELAWPAAQRASRWDTDQWRLMIALDPHWLVAAHQVDVDSSLTAPARPSTEAAVAAGHLVNCELGTHVLACGEPLRGSAAVVGGEVVIRIRDARWRRTLRAAHPRSAHLLFVRAGQDVIWTGVVDIDYR